MAQARKKGAWRGPFLRELRRTGNARAAARKAGIDDTTAYAARRRDARFAGQWAAAAAAGRAAAGKRPAPKRAPREGVELVLRRGRKGDQLVKAGAGRWSARIERIVLTTLIQTGCLQRAADACGLSAEALYNRRRRYPEFAALWDAALREAEPRVPQMLTAAAIAGLDPGAAGLDVPKADIDQAIAICRMRGWGMADRPGRAKPPIRVEPSIEEVREEVERRLAALRRSREADGWNGDSGENGDEDGDRDGCDGNGDNC